MEKGYIKIARSSKLMNKSLFFVAFNSSQVDVGNVVGSMDSKHGQQGGNQIQVVEENLALTSPDSSSRGRTR